MTNNPQLDPIPSGASPIDPLKSALINKLVKTATDQAGVAVGNFVAAAAPTIISMGLDELEALQTQLANKKTAAALQQISDHASLADLAAQKQTIATVAAKMAQDNAASKEFWNDFVYRGLTVALSALVLL